MQKKTHHVGLIFIDLDNFKHYNDTFLYDVGDLILKEMAKIFRKAVKGKDLSPIWRGLIYYDLKYR